MPKRESSIAVVEKADEEQIRLTDVTGCPFYSARRIRGVKIAPSPPWLRQRLESIGLRSINNVVDITNYVLMEMGQPLHAFDSAKLSGGIEVRAAKEDESIAALDGQTYPLQTSDLVIADAQNAVAIAGVMGGSASSVSDSTTNILLEAAWFQPSRVRATARRLGLSTDSSYRFERGVDASQVLAASELATSLMVELAGGTAEPAILTAGEVPALTGAVAMVHSDLRRFLGAEVPDEEITGILSRLGLKELPRNAAGGSKWLIPGYRVDLQRAVDLYEEVARVHGLDTIPEKRQAPFVPATDVDRRHDAKLALVRQLTGLGIDEAITIKLISDTEATSALSLDGAPLQPVRVRNPISDDHTTMRPGLLPGLLASAALNRRQGQNGCRFVETGRVFLGQTDGSVQETERIGLLLWGESVQPSWHGREPRAQDWFDLKGAVASMLPAHRELSWEKTARDGLIVAAEIKESSQRLGCAGILHPSKARELDLTGEVLYAELDLNALLALRTAVVISKDLPRYPSITRDIALEAPAELSQADIRAAFLQSNEPLLESIALFDLFKDASGQKLAADRKSLAFTLTYRHAERTLESTEVDAAHAKLVSAVKAALPLTVR